MGHYDHASWQQALQHWFLNHSREWSVRVRPELLVQTTKRNFRVPDVVVFDRDNPIEQILTRPPIAVFEVLSPEDRIPRMMKKLAEYEAMGIPTIVLVDPEQSTISLFQGGNLIELEESVQQLVRDRCFIDWQKVRELLD